MFFDKILKTVEKPVYRFNNCGFRRLGVDIKPYKDNRTTGQIIAVISELLDKNPSLKGFKDTLKNVEDKYRGLIADTLELSHSRDFLMTNIDMNAAHPQSGKSPIQMLLEAIPKAAKENPQTLDFAKEVINTTDSVTSKYFLCELLSVINKPEYGKYFEAVKPMVRDIAEQTLNGGYLGTYKKQQDFMKFIKLLVNPENNVEKVKLVQKLNNALNEIPSGIEHSVYLDTFIKSNAPVQRVSENIDTLKSVAQMYAQNGKQLDVVEFVNNNVNLV